MDKEYLKNKISDWWHHFVESTIHERAMGFLWWSSYDQKGMPKIKRLEMERSWKKIEHKDVAKTDQKIKELNSNSETQR